MIKCLGRGFRCLGRGCRIVLIRGPCCGRVGGFSALCITERCLGGA